MTPNRRSRFFLFGLLVLLVVIGVVIYLWPRDRSKVPPTIDSAGLDPAVAQAIQKARDAVVSQPRPAATWGELGMVLFAHAMYPESLPCFEEAERLDPADPHWPYYQALVHVLGDQEQALACLNRAVDRAGGEVSPRARRGEVLLALERWDEARKEFEDVRQRRPTHPRAAVGLGQIAARNGQWDRAVELLTPLTDDPTTRRAARTVLAEVAARRGDSATATIHQAALADLPKDVPWEDPYLESIQKRQVSQFLRLDRANQLIARQQFGAAESLLAEILQADPRSDEAYLYLGRLYSATGDPIRAEKALRKCLDLAPRTVLAHFLLGAARFQQGDIAGAEKSFRVAADIQPEYAPAHYQIGECRKKQKDLPAAITAYRAAVRSRPNMVEAHLALGAALLEAGERAEALRHLEDARRLKPDDEKANRLLKEARGS
jgi:tetratricopeptide (TPR) repeat protein